MVLIGQLSPVDDPDLRLVLDSLRMSTGSLLCSYSWGGRRHSSRPWSNRREVPLQGTARLQLSMEVYNVTNTPSFANPNGQLGNAAFGTITNTIGTLRQLQFAVKLLF